MALSLLAVGFSFVAKESREKLADRIGEPEMHASLGDVMPIVVTVLAVRAALVSAGATWQMVRVGDSGAR